MRSAGSKMHLRHHMEGRVPWAHTQSLSSFMGKISSKPNPTRATFSPREYLVVPEDNITKEMLQAQWDRESTNIL